MRRIKLPAHIALIMDGNGRWAKRRFRPRSYGHRMGVQNMVRICSHAFRLGVRIVTVYALSTENLFRPKEELDTLFDLIRTYFSKKKDKLLEMGVKINVIGDLSVFPPQTSERNILRVMDGTRSLTDGLFNICLDYGLAGRRSCARRQRGGGAGSLRRRGELFTSLLQTGGLPDPDLNHPHGRGGAPSPTSCSTRPPMPSLYFSNKMWPEFTKRDLEKAIGKTTPRATAGSANVEEED